MLNGYKNISNPLAKRIHLKVGSGGLREKDLGMLFVLKVFAPRPVPSVLYLFRKYFGIKLTLLAMLRNLPLSYIPYRNKGNASLKIVAFILLIIVWPFVNSTFVS